MRRRAVRALPSLSPMSTASGCSSFDHAGHVAGDDRGHQPLHQPTLLVERHARRRVGVRGGAAAAGGVLAGGRLRRRRGSRPISANGTENASCSTNATRCSGVSLSSTTIAAMRTSSVAHDRVKWIVARRGAERGHDRLGQPRADVALALRGGRTQPVEADPADHGGEPRPQVADLRAPLLVQPGQSQPRLLHGVLRVGQRARQPVRHPDQVGPVRRELLGENVIADRHTAMVGRAGRDLPAHCRAARLDSVTVAGRIRESDIAQVRERNRIDERRRGVRVAAPRGRRRAEGPVPVPRREDAVVQRAVRRTARSTASAAARAATSSPSS